MLTDSSVLSLGGSVAEVAAHYLRLIRQVQPQGPYRFGGYSFGGLVAYEMAQQVRAAGGEVERVFLFDINNPSVPARYFSLPERIRVRWEIDREAGMNLGQRSYSLIARTVSGYIERRRLLRHQAKVAAARAAGERIAVGQQCMVLIDMYRPAPTEQALTLFRSMGRNDKTEHTLGLGWEEVARGPLEIIPITGTHHFMFDEPHVSLLAQKLAEHLPASKSPAIA